MSSVNRFGSEARAIRKVSGFAGDLAVTFNVDGLVYARSPDDSIIQYGKIEDEMHKSRSVSEPVVYHFETRCGP